MSLRIRLSKIGKKNRPAYRIIVSEKRSHPRGSFTDLIGYFDPYNPQKNQIDTKKLEYWKGVGAQISKSVEKIVGGKYKFDPYRGSAKKTQP